MRKYNYITKNFLIKEYIKYKKINMRSSWETKFAQFLDLLGFNWIYEPRIFDLGNMTYTPDFYIPKRDLYVEIKGYISDIFKKKFKKFKKSYPQIKIKVLVYKDLKKLGILK